ncbi:unnamed protein product, partial [Prorocentrum cordatum]
ALGGSANADMTAHDARWAAVFDGVGGVPPPLRPEALSQDLRDCVRHNLRQRFKVAAAVGYGAETVDTSSKGARLRRLVQMSIGQTTALGSACAAVATVIGRPLTYFNVGDCAVQVFRPNSVLGTYTKIFNTDKQHQPMTDSSGNNVMGPKQICIMREQGRDPAIVSHLVSQGAAGKVHVMLDDYVIVSSDGIGDNLNDNQIIE